jgi:hypothetical protein
MREITELEPDEPDEPDELPLELLDDPPLELPEEARWRSGWLTEMPSECAVAGPTIPSTVRPCARW